MTDSSKTFQNFIYGKNLVADLTLLGTYIALSHSTLQFARERLAGVLHYRNLADMYHQADLATAPAVLAKRFSSNRIIQEKVAEINRHLRKSRGSRLVPLNEKQATEISQLLKESQPIRDGHLPRYYADSRGQAYIWLSLAREHHLEVNMLACYTSGNAYGDGDTTAQWRVDRYIIGGPAVTADFRRE